MKYQQFGDVVFNSSNRKDLEKLLERDGRDIVIRFISHAAHGANHYVFVYYDLI